MCKRVIFLNVLHNCLEIEIKPEFLRITQMLRKCALVCSHYFSILFALLSVK